MPIPEERFQAVAVDFMELPLSAAGHDMAMIVVDKLTKLVQVTPMHKTDDAKETARLFLEHWVLSGKGLPETLISDRDTRFTSSFWTALMEQLQVKLVMSTARHQQTNGQAEHAVKMTKNCLRAFTDYKGRNWDQLIPHVQFALNNSVSSCTGYTPFRLAYGFNPGQAVAKTEVDLDKAIQENISSALIRLAKQQDVMEEQANQNRSVIRPVKVGDRVLVKRDGIKWPADALDDQKLLSKYLGPFRVRSVDEHGNYQLELPSALRIHDHFAPGVVKRYHEPDEHFPDRDVPAPIQEAYDPETEYEVERIMDHRVVRKQKQFLVRWVGYGREHDSWVDAYSGTNEEHLVHAYQQSRGGVIDWVKPVGKTRRLISPALESRGNT